jgi:hypothetical protein
VACNLDAAAVKAMAAGTALNVDPPGFVAASMRDRGVILDRQEFKVRQSVVVLDAVSVVDVLSCCQRSSEMASHDNTVFKLEVRADSHCDVSVRADKAARVLDSSSALHRAEAHATS